VGAAIKGSCDQRKLGQGWEMLQGLWTPGWGCRCDAVSSRRRVSWAWECFSSPTPQALVLLEMDVSCRAGAKAGGEGRCRSRDHGGRVIPEHPVPASLLLVSPGSHRDTCNSWLLL